MLKITVLKNATSFSKLVFSNDTDPELFLSVDKFENDFKRIILEVNKCLGNKIHNKKII